jgi:hypothetical protein
VISATLPASRDIVSGDGGLSQQRGHFGAELFVGLLEAGMVPFAECHEQVAGADHLTLFDQLIGHLLRGAADELFVAEGRNRLVRTVE